MHGNALNSVRVAGHGVDDHDDLIVKLID